MINANVIVWLLTGGMIGSLAVLENHFSAALLVSLLAAIGLLTIFDLIRRQPIR